MKVTDRSRLLGRTKATKATRAPKLRSRLGESAVGSFRRKLDWSWLCGCIRRRGVWGAEVEDLAQEALWVVARIEARPRPPQRPGQTKQQRRRALLRRVVRCLVWSYFRHRDKHRTDLREDIEQLAGDAPHGDEAMITREDERREQQRRTQLLEAALSHLATRDRDAHAVLEAHELRGEPVVAIAARLSIPTNTAHTRLRRGRRELRAFAERRAARSRARAGRSTAR